MYAFLFLGFLVGMGHSLEADHLAAVGAMATGRSSKKRLALLGAAWGLGHTITLFLLCSAVIFFEFVLTERGTAAMEFAVGMMLVILGLDVLRRMGRARMHFHVHDHGDGYPHIHAHSHLGSKLPHAVDPHDHAHPQTFPVKALLVGLMHGAAGSAGLLALALAVSREPWIAITYVLLFGVGSMCGMAALTCLAAWPLGLAERSATWLHHGLQCAISCVAIVLGISAMLESGYLIWKLPI
jgi:hypothetical protein